MMSSKQVIRLVTTVRKKSLNKELLWENERASPDMRIVPIGGVKSSSLTVRRRRGPAESVPQTCRPSASLSRLGFGLALLGLVSILLPVQLQTIAQPHIYPQYEGIFALYVFPRFVYSFHFIISPERERACQFQTFWCTLMTLYHPNAGSWVVGWSFVVMLPLSLFVTVIPRQSERKVTQNGGRG